MLLTKLLHAARGLPSYQKGDDANDGQEGDADKDSRLCHRRFVVGQAQNFERNVYERVWPCFGSFLLKFEITVLHLYVWTWTYLRIAE